MTARKFVRGLILLLLSGSFALAATPVNEPPSPFVADEAHEALLSLEELSIPLLNDDETALVGLFLPEAVYSALNLEGYELRNRAKTPPLELPRCSRLLTTKEVSVDTVLLRCEDVLYVSLIALPRLRVYKFYEHGLEDVKFVGMGGTLNLEVEDDKYPYAFAYASDDIAQRYSELTELRGLLAVQKQANAQKAAEQQRQAAEQQRKAQQQKQEEARKQAQVREQLRQVFRTAASQAVLLDGTLALPLGVIAQGLGYSVTRDELLETCYDVSRSDTWESPRSICDEVAWGTTNYVPKVIAGRLYAPLPVINAILKGVGLSYDPKTASLRVKLFNPGQADDFTVKIADKLQSYRTLTRARIYPYRTADLPRCSTARIDRPAYTLTFSASSDYDYISVRLQSKSNSTILVIWDESSVRLPSGRSSGVMHEGVRFIEADSPQAPTPVAPRGTLSDMMVAKTTLWFGEYSKKWYYSMFDVSVRYDTERLSIFVSGSNHSVSGSLALQVGGRRVYESFTITCTVKPGEFRVGM
ncbi:hypothetical protein Mterra_00992 [Calidithermus terrae]|uniref:Copper amine oxidase-like N-terminal domain-containing protein n=1 Tax=Calidithermus terrae TaxID=1408545 RepID=A0A399EW81_9DEIN|nr:hypothetical protein [Calidithermus terrae]RIH88288.1 hypothetical protein Mterra_00992 [Calidithermus terrae]